MEFKNRIRDLRSAEGVSATKLASVLEKSESAVRMWEVGKSKPDADTLIKLARIFNCSTDYLLGLNDFRNLKEREELAALYTELAEKQKGLELMFENIIEIMNGEHGDILYDEAVKMVEFLLICSQAEVKIKKIVNEYNSNSSADLEMKDYLISNLLLENYVVASSARRLRSYIDALENMSLKSFEEAIETIAGSDFDNFIKIVRKDRRLNATQNKL